MCEKAKDGMEIQIRFLLVEGYKLLVVGVERETRTFGFGSCSSY